MRGTRFTITSMVLVALCAAAAVSPSSAHTATVCSQPTIDRIDWTFVAAADDLWMPVYKVRFNLYDAAGDIIYAKNDTDVESQHFDAGTNTGVAVFEPNDVMMTSFDRKVTFAVESACGSSEVTVDALPPKDSSWINPASGTAGPPLKCPAVLVIDSRGSGEPSGKLSPPAQKFVQLLKKSRPGINIQAFGNPYSAVSIAGGWRYYLNLLGARFRLPKLGAYNDSVGAGVRLLTTLVPKEAAICPQTKVVLTGYSQGAQVAGDYTLLNPGQIAATVLFGDPKFNPLYAGDRGGFDKRLSGALGTRPYFAQSSFVLSFCHRYDPVCQFSLGSIKSTLQRHKVTQHENYDSLKEGGLTDPEQAARLVASRLLPRG